MMMGDTTDSKCPRCGRVLYNTWSIAYDDLEAGTYKVQCPFCKQEVAMRVVKINHYMAMELP